MDRTEKVARAIAAEKRKLPPDSPEIDRVWSSYVGQARAALAAADEWLPIESAPRDKTPVLLCANVRDDGTPYQTDVYHAWYSGLCAGGWKRWPHSFPPTHWRPLPSPPGVG